MANNQIDNASHNGEDPKTLADALIEIDRLKAQNTALRGSGRINREAKNSVFLDLFGRKEYLYQMFQSLCPEETDVSEDDLAVVTIDNVLTVKHFNDLGVLVSRKKRRKLLILAEAQSLWSVNVIFRLWEYVIDTLMNYFINNGYDIYSSAKLDMPDVETYIIYTGKSIPRAISSGKLDKDKDGHPVLSLNKEFFGGEAGKPELTAKVFSMKEGDGGIIDEYIRFSQIFDEQVSKYKNEPEKAFSEIFKICAEKNILVAYLAEHRSEVEKIMLTMVSPEYVQRASERTRQIRSAIDMGRDGGLPDDQIISSLVKRFHITPQYAQNCLDAEWDDTEVYA